MDDAAEDSEPSDSTMTCPTCGEGLIEEKSKVKKRSARKKRPGKNARKNANP